MRTEVRKHPLKVGAKVLFVCAAVAALAMPAPLSAAPLTDLSYRVHPAVSGAFANHTIMFRSTSGMTGGTLALNLGTVISTLGSITISDIDLMYGSTQATLAESAGAGVWGVSVSEAAKSITFTYPSTGGTPVPAGSMVLVKIGKHANFQAEGNKRMVNNGAGTLSANVTAGADTGTASVTIFSEVQTNTQMTNASSSNSLRLNVSAGNQTGEVAVSLIENDTFGVLATRIDQGAGAGGIFPPTSLGGTAPSEGVIQLSWKDNSQVELGYIVERKLVKAGLASDFEPIALLDRNTSGYTDKRLPPGVTLLYRVRAYNDTHFSLYANSSEVKTLQPAVPVAPLKGLIPALTEQIRPTPPPLPAEPEVRQFVPAPPANVSNLAGIAGVQSARLVWENPSDPDLLYIQIQWSETAFPASPTDGVTVFQDMGTSFSDMNLPGGLPSYYTVFVVNKYGLASSGSFVAVTPLAPPAAPSQPALPPAPPPPPPTPIQEPEQTAVAAPPGAVVLTLSPPISGSFEPQRAGSLLAVNTDSTGGAQSLSVTVPPAVVSETYRLSVASYSVDQAQEIDPTITIPADEGIAAQTVYQVTVEKQEEEVRKFVKPITLEFRYSKSSLGDINESTLRVRTWNPLVSQWLDISSVVDTEKRIVRGTTNHLSLFSLFGEKKHEKKTAALTVVPQAKVQKPDLPTLRASKIFDLSQFITAAGRDLTVEAGSEVNLCVNQELFPRPVRFMSLSINASKYFLVYDFTRRCYAANIVMPASVGSHSLDVKVVFADDFSQTGAFVLKTTEKKRVFSIPPRLTTLAESVPSAPSSLILYAVLGAVLLISIGVGRLLYRAWRL